MLERWLLAFLHPLKRSHNGLSRTDSHANKVDSLLGWNICDLNLTTGALFGYSSVNAKVSLKVPASSV